MPSALWLFPPAKIDYARSTFAVTHRNRFTYVPKIFSDREEHAAAAVQTVLDDTSSRLVPTCLTLHPKQNVVSVPGMALFLINEKTCELIEGMAGAIIEPFEGDVFEKI